MEVLDTTIVNVALPHIAGSLSSSSDEATSALTSYLVANGIVLTISGWLGDLLGRKRYFIICIAMFTVCSFSAARLPACPVDHLSIGPGFFGGGSSQTSSPSSSTPSRRQGAARHSGLRPSPPSWLRCSVDAERLHHRPGKLALDIPVEYSGSASSRCFWSRCWSRILPGRRQEKPRHRLHRTIVDHPGARNPPDHDGSRRGRGLVRIRTSSA